MPVRPSGSEVRLRLEVLLQRAKALEADGLPGFPTEQIQTAVLQAVGSQQPENATQVLKRAEALIDRVTRDWTWVKELLRRADELRAIAATIGVDLGHLDARVGNPRKRLLSEPLSAGALEKTAASASLALAVLNDAVPKFCVQEAQKLGGSIRAARDRGEEVREATTAFSRLLQAIQDENLPTAAQRLVEARKAVARIPRAPAMPRLSGEEEEEILLEARNLARRLQRIKTKAHDAHSAARLMSQVRQALAEDRRYGTPEEEIEELWLEVDRITRERRRASEAPPATGRAEPDERPRAEVVPAAAASDPGAASSPPWVPAELGGVPARSAVPPRRAAAPDADSAPAREAEDAKDGRPTDAPASEPLPEPETTSSPEDDPQRERPRRGYAPPYVLPEFPLPGPPSDPNPPSRPRLRPRLPP